jgi:hypothetical protein
MSAAEKWAVYFDTNVLQAGRWPRPFAALDRLAGLVRELDIELFLPEPVEVELDERWARDFRASLAKAHSAANDLQKHHGEIFEHDTRLVAPELQFRLSEYRKLSGQMKEKFALRSCPTTTRPTKDFVLMASRRNPPFKDRDIGFRDAVIFHSILDHAEAQGIRVLSLVSQDTMFDAPELAGEAQARGLIMAVFKSINDLVEELTTSLEEAEQARIAEDRRRARSLVEGAAHQLSEFISTRLQITDADVSIGFGRLKRLEQIEFVGIRNVQIPVPLPETDARVALSLEVDVKIHLIVSRYVPPPARPLKPGEDLSTDLLRESLGSTEVETSQSVDNVVEIEATAQRSRHGDYSTLALESARLKPTVASLLSALARLPQARGS